MITFEVDFDELFELSKKYIEEKLGETSIEDLFIPMFGEYDITSFRDLPSVIDEDTTCFITYDGPAEPSSIDVRKVYAVSIFKYFYGRKMMFFAVRSPLSYETDPMERYEIHRIVKDAVRDHIISLMKDYWVEIPEKLEYYFYNILGDYYIVDPNILKDNNVIEDMEIATDNRHYYRKGRDGKESKMIAFGRLRIYKRS